jgi:hypothetical protein
MQSHTDEPVIPTQEESPSGGRPRTRGFLVADRVPSGRGMTVCIHSLVWGNALYSMILLCEILLCDFSYSVNPVSINERTYENDCDDFGGW